MINSTGRFTAQPVFIISPGNESDLVSFCRLVIPYLINMRLHVSLVFTEGLLCDRWSTEMVGGPDDMHCVVVEKGAILDHLPVISRGTDIVFIVSDSSETSTIPADRFMPGRFASEPLKGAELLYSRVKKVSMDRQVWGCVLIGGRSSRMGRPKHLLTTATGETWLERVVAILRSRLAGVVLSGSGEIPASVEQLVRLTDVSVGQGPLTGISSAMRWRPDVSWLVVACDMPGVTMEAIDWLLGTRAPGRWATVPQFPGKKRGEPLFALYGPQCGPLFEQMLVEEYYAIQGICRNSRVDFVQIPEDLEVAWSNVNTPDQLEGFNRGK